MNIRRIIREEVERVLSEKETVEQFYEIFSKKSDFLTNSLRNPNFELRLTQM